MNLDKDLVAAMATPLVLAILARGRSYGYAILKQVHDLSGGDIAWTDGMLYPLLHRLERLGHVEASWGESPEGRKRKYYAITAAGEAALAEHRRQWSTATRTLGGIWGAAIPGAAMPGAAVAGGAW